MALTIFETIRYIEEKQWQLVGLEEERETVENSIRQTAQYNPYSNPTYLKKERKSNLFIASTLDYFAFGLPVTVLLFIIFNRLFRCLFDF